ncbi:uncharacterized protein LODBEIA_P01760 [Lodderomyces beijingensis]|uniref:Enolase-phosphatase E1 n=1 Tax=Lodderomyces beijingensis TaxID=1775926 RepID=A0ABP0ZCP8_9ASCO
MAIDTVILDIEGTVCPITFVKDKLFPYFLDKLPSCLDAIQFPLSRNASQDPIVEILSQLPPDITTSSNATFSHFKNLVENDVKDPVLKSLQGLVWKHGYQSGELQSPVYKDSVDFIESFPTQHKGKIYIYSSGSIPAQKLLFSHVYNQGASSAIDLNPKLSGYFDITTAGSKQEASSYAKILDQIEKQADPKSVLFLSDNLKEVEAAIEAGVNSYIVVRQGNAPISQSHLSKHKVIETLAGLDL